MALQRNDSDLQRDILKELKWEPQVAETDIGVIVKDGAVTLMGTVPSYTDKIAAKRAAKRIKGVRAIADELQVKLPVQMEGSDEDIAHRIAKMFEWNAAIPADDIKAEVRNGIVTLSGAVDWHYLSNNVRRQVEDIRGVKHVINDITVRKRTTSYDVKHEIEEALRRHADVEASRVKVSVSGSTVTLEGTVDSFPEIDLIEDAAWAAQGVTRVIDHLRVT